MGTNFLIVVCFAHTVLMVSLWRQFEDGYGTVWFAIYQTFFTVWQWWRLVEKVRREEREEN